VAEHHEISGSALVASMLCRRSPHFHEQSQSKSSGNRFASARVA